MGFSFSRDRRRQANAHHPQVQTMRTMASRYGEHSGSASDTQTFIELFERFARQAPGAGWGVAQEGPRVAYEAAKSSYPLAVHAAWAVAALLPSSTITSLTGVMGQANLVAGATLLTDEFPGLVKTPVLGRKIKLWRAPAAITVVLLASEAG